MVEAEMVRKSVQQQEALRRSRERSRAKQAAETLLPPEDVGRLDALPLRSPTETDRRRLAASICGWCGGPIEYKARGRIPKWCSAACRQRAWEQSRAAASGRSAVQVIERRVEIPTQRPAPSPARPRHAEWIGVLDELATQLDTGAIYDRDLSALTGSLNRVLEAFERRPHVRHRARDR
jgi:hypothetical protein